MTLMPVTAFAQDGRAVDGPSLNFNGVPGLMDLPSGETLPDGTFNVSVAAFGPIKRATLGFQITPWLAGSFRLQNIGKWDDAPQHQNDFYSSYNDRSFDLRIRLLEESAYVPAVTLGFQDFIGTGLFSGEYLAATKNIGQVKVTGGLGWGRYGSYSPVATPFGTRPEIFDPSTDMGGKPHGDAWFKGDMSVFGGIEYEVSDTLGVKVEYSTDAYAMEVGERQVFDRDSSVNFGLEYQMNDFTRLGLYSMYGKEWGLSYHLVLDPKSRRSVGILGAAPVAVGTRPSRESDPDAWDQGWVTQTDAAPILRNNLSKILDRDGILIEDLTYTATRATIRIRNTKLDAAAQAIGRTARALSHVMPASVEEFEVVPMVRGVGVSKVTIRRADLEQLEHSPNNGAILRERVLFSDAGTRAVSGTGPQEGLYPRFNWNLQPGYRVSAPGRGDIGVRGFASYDLHPGLVLSGRGYLRLADNHDKVQVLDKGGSLDPVRSDVRLYNQDSTFAVERLTLDWYSHPLENIYTRMSFGLLERMHGGLSAEVLWKPADSNFALGAEVNYTAQRATDGGFEFGYIRENEDTGVPYAYEHSALTGHVSAYYDFDNGYTGQLDMGRYLAGDLGATLTLNREFANGWKVGAFATLTDATSKEVGEGSFDKGIHLDIPLNWVLGTPSRNVFSQTMRPVQRDGGARVDVSGRIYETIRDYHTDRIDDQWDRVWR